MPKPPKNELAREFPEGSLPGVALSRSLQAFRTDNRLTGKGQIATMIFASRLARRTGLPFDVEKGIKTEGEARSKA